MYQFSFNTEINWFQFNAQDDDVNIQKKRISYMYAQSHHERSISNYQSSISNYQSWVHYKKDTNWPTKKKEIDWTTTPDFPYRKLRDLHNTLSFSFLRICKPLNDQLFCNLFNRFAGKTRKTLSMTGISSLYMGKKKDTLFNMPKTTYQITILLFFWIIKWYTWKS